MLPTYSFIKIVWFEDRIVFFLLVAVSTLKKTFQERKKIHSGLFLSLAITGIDVNDIIRYPSSSLKYHLTSILTVF